MDIWEPQFTIGQIAKKTGVSANTIRAWYQRGDVPIGETDMDTPGERFARKLSGATGILLAIMGHLTARGVPTGIAAHAAKLFAYSGNEDRFPCHLFPQGSTLLLVGKGGALVRNITLGDRYGDVVSSAVLRAIGEESSVLIFELDEFVDRIRVQLGLGRDPLQASGGRPTGYAH